MTPRALPLLVRLFKSYGRPYGRLLFFGSLCLVITSALSVAPAKMLEYVVNDIFFRKDETMLLPITLGIIVIFLAKGLISYGASVIMALAGQRLMGDLQKDMLSSLLKADLSTFQKKTSGDLVTRLTLDLEKLRETLTKTMISIFKDSLAALGFVILMISHDLFLSFICLFILPLAFYPLVRLGRLLRTTSLHIQEKTGELMGHLTQIFHSIRVIKSYGAEEHEKKKVFSMIHGLIREKMRVARAKHASHPLMEFLGGVAMSGVIFYGGHKVMVGSQTPGAFFSFIAALLMAYEPIKRLTHLNGVLQEQIACAARTFEILDLKPRIFSPKKPQSLEKISGNISFNHVSFSYEPREAGTLFQETHPAPQLKEKQGPLSTLTDIQLSVKPGEKVAFVGPSGSGKSTLLNLLLRFYDPSYGNIFLEGHDLRSLDLKTVRQSMALVSQDVVLFKGSVLDNIVYGQKRPDKDTLHQVCQDAACFDFIQNLPHGLETSVGERGQTLSGGQRQRIAIARALLKDAPILLLDEPTSSLDGESERLVQKALDKIMRHKTTLIVAHRLSTVRNADRIFVLDRGKIVGVGSHEHLMDTCENYRTLWVMPNAINK